MRNLSSLVRGGCVRQGQNKTLITPKTTLNQIGFVECAGKYSLLSRLIREKKKPVTDFTLTMFASRAGFPVHLYQGVSEEKRISFLNSLGGYHGDAVQNWISGELKKTEARADIHLKSDSVLSTTKRPCFDQMCVDRIGMLEKYTGDQEDFILETDQVYRSIVSRLDAVSYGTLDSGLKEHTVNFLLSSVHTKKILSIMLYMGSMSLSSRQFNSKEEIEQLLMKKLKLSQKISPLDWLLNPTEYELSEFAPKERHPVDTDVMYSLVSSL